MIKVLVNGSTGKMGSEVIKAVTEDSQLELVGAISSKDNLKQELLITKPDVVVDFTVSSVGYRNAKTILEYNACPVIGTSGFQLAQVEELITISIERNLGGVIAPNFSIGSILMMKMATHLSKFYSNSEIIEVHGPHKEDSPSGTAIRTAEMLSRDESDFSKCNNEIELIKGARGASIQGVRLHSLRLPGFVAQQTIMFANEYDTFKIEHNSLDRKCFMPGVCLACKSVTAKNKLYYGLEHFIFEDNTTFLQ